MNKTLKTIPKNGFKLPDGDHVMRHVPWSKLRKDENDKVLGFLPQAFKLRSEEKSLSVNWLEIFDGGHDARAKQTIHELRAAKSIGKKSAFGIGNVGNIKTICKTNGATVKIVYAPTHGNSSHSEMRDLPSDDLSILEALATDAFAELVHNADI
jgi:hypothetical protein